MERLTLIDWRKRAGLSRANVARRLVVTEATVWRWEVGKRQPGAAHLLRLAELYQIDPRMVDLERRPAAGVIDSEA